MRRRISWLVGATTSAVILAFVIPLCLLVRTAAEERALTGASQESRNVAILVSGLHSDPQLAELIRGADSRGPAATSVLTPDGGTLGTPDDDLAEDIDVIRAAAGEAFTMRDNSGGKVLVPVVTETGTFVVRTTLDDETMRQGVARAWAIIISLGVALMLSAVVIAGRIGRRVSIPVTALAEVAHRLKDGDLGARARREGPPETIALADALNQLADRTSELLAAERAQVGDLSHRLRTPVTALRLDAESVADEELGARLQAHVAVLQRTIDAIVRDARRPLRHTMHSSCDASLVVQERISFWSALAEDQGRSLTFDLAVPPLVVPVDKVDLSDVFDVLIDNVFAHTGEGVAFHIELRRTDDKVVLEVSDRGPGMPTDPQPSPQPGRTGLGLQIVRRTVAAIGGDLTIISSPGQGTTVRVALPRS